jgi:hypothetical protein
MVNFNQETRKRCRHCKMNLPVPTSNARQAFCRRAATNRSTGIAAWRAKTRSSGRQPIAKSARNRSAGTLYADSGKTTHGSKNLEPAPETLISCGSASASDTVARSNRVCANFGIDQAIRANRARIVGPKRVLDVEIGGREKIVSPDGVVCYVTSLRRPAMKVAA